MERGDDDLFEAFSDCEKERKKKNNNTRMKNEFSGKKRERSTTKISKSINDLLTEDDDGDKESKLIDVIVKKKEIKVNAEEDEDVLIEKSIKKILLEDEDKDEILFRCNNNKANTDKGNNQYQSEYMGIIIESFELSGCVHENIREKQFKGSFSLIKDVELTPATKYPFKLDAFQERAILCLENRQSVLVAAHTSAGKTVVAQYAIAMALRDGQRVIYTSPIKALSNQKYRELAHEFKDVGLMTGDVSLNPTARCIVMTTEILRNMLYKGSEITREMAWVIFDEVHYMRDKERGVVWEETIILLSNKINYVFLSATIPNAREFAMWISKLKSQPCNVVYTDFRPVPLQHYIYTPFSSEGISLVVDAQGHFRENNFNDVMAKLYAETKIDNIIEKKKKNSSRDKQKNDEIKKIMSLITSRGLDPAIVFSFSKKECEENALALQKMDFTTEDEKEAIETIYTNAVHTLAEEDQDIDSIKNMLSFLKSGIGIHHGGILPLLKECVELLFQEGLIKVLFSTETFSMGINMPAKTVVFSSIEKWDGENTRNLTGGEYIQMSGRAGRRGIDDQGIVIVIIKNIINQSVIKNIFKGISDPLDSSFHLNYNQLVNLYRIEGMECEYIVKRSFRQFQAEQSVPLMRKNLAALHDSYKQLSLNKDREKIIQSLININIQIEQFKEENRLIIIEPNNILPFCIPGRLVKIYNWGYGIIVNYTKKEIRLKPGEKLHKTNMEIQEEINKSSDLIVVDIIVLVKSHVNEELKLLPASLDDPDTKIGIVPFFLRSLEIVSPIKVNLPQDLKNPSNMDLTRQMLTNLFTKFQANIPLMDPIKDMGIQNKALSQNIEKISTLEKRKWEIEKEAKANYGDLNDEMCIVNQKMELKKQIKSLIEKYYSITKLVLQDELNNMKRVLRRLEFVKDDVVTLKGQIACNISSGDELLLTEMLFNGSFNELTEEELAAVLTCFLNNEGSSNKKSGSSEEKVKKEYLKLFEFHDLIKANAERIHEVLHDCKIEIKKEEYVNKFTDEFMIPIYKWAKGDKFVDVVSNDVYEGHLIRSIRRIDELIKQISESAQQIGNYGLKEKLVKSSFLIRRGLPFAASLYLNN